MQLNITVDSVDGNELHEMLAILDIDKIGPKTTLY